jgi:integrase
MRRRQSLPVAEWPAADRTLWAWLRRGGGVLDPRGPLAHLKPVSLDGIAVCHGRWLCWVAQVHPAALAEDPVARCTGARFVAWLADGSGLAPASRQRQAEKVLRLLRAAAPEADWSAHERQVALLRREARLTPSRRKAGRILSSDVLLQAALDLAGRNRDHDARCGPRAARRRRDATMVALLAVMPLRRRAFVALEPGRSVLRDGDRIVIALDATLTKTGQVWEAVVPEPVAGLLRHYLDRVRPILLARAGEASAALWLNDHGRPYGDIHLGQRITRITERLTGVRVSPHLFRDCAATTLVRSGAGSARITRDLLGHASFRTAEHHYIHARMIEASRDYARAIDAARAAHPARGPAGQTGPGPIPAAGRRRPGPATED